MRFARDRRRDDGCTCVGCGAPVVLRAGELRRAHFAHASTQPCRAETALHRATIAILAEELERASRDRRPLTAPQACRDCDRVATRNLAKVAGIAAHAERTIEHGGRTARPDLLVCRGDRALYAIEVVVTHEPEESAREVMGGLGLPIVIVRPSWELLHVLALPIASVAALGEAAIEGARCDGWRHPPGAPRRCTGCDRDGTLVTVQRWAGAPCWRCERPVPYVDVRAHDDLVAHDCDGWDGQPLALASTIGAAIVPLASALGASLDERWTYRTGCPSVVHACAECGATQGRAGRGKESEPSAVLAASWCRRCARIDAIGEVRSR